MQEIKTVNFMLTYLPFEKWKEDVIYHLLKQIRNL